MSKRKLFALWLAVMLVFAAFTGGVTTALLSDSERMQITITAGNAGNVGNWASTSSSESEYEGDGDPGIDYVAFVSEDSDPGVSWSVGSENANGEPTSILWTAAMNKDVDYVVVGYGYDGQDKVNIYDYTGRDGVAGTATSLGSSDPTRSIANVTSYDVSDALGVDEIAAEANNITDEELDDANTTGIDANTTLRIAYDANSDAFSGELAGQGSYTLPRAADDSNSTTAGTTLEVSAPGVLGNDTPGDADPSMWVSASNGTVTLHANGSFGYEPDSGFTGEDSFTYRLSDGVAADTATVNITVSAS